MSLFNKLKPCPFCGSRNTDRALVTTTSVDGSNERALPGCKDCGAQAESIAKWNTRPLKDTNARRIEGGSVLIMVERCRQLDVEGYSAEKDDGYTHRELLGAAQAYIMAALVESGPKPYTPTYPPKTWPWSDEHFKPDGAVRDLVKAGALIAAELDRLMRLETAASK